MREIVQLQHAIEYWENTGRKNEEKFVELANFGIEFVRHVSMPKPLAKKHHDLNSGFVAKISYVTGCLLYTSDAADE